MNSIPVTVIAEVKAQPGKEAQLCKALLSLVEPSRRDAGCINDDLHQCQEEPAHFMFHENWATREKLDQHLAKPDLRAALAHIGTLVAEPPKITFWSKIA